MLHQPPASFPRIGVLTFHRCINYGSYWQARCLVEGLRESGVNAVLLDHDSPAINRVEWRCALRPTLPIPSPRSDFSAYAAKTRKFLTALRSLPSSPTFALDEPAAAGRYDAIIIGSDEVWNLRHPWYGGRPIFYGAGLLTDRLVSYAASFGNHDAAEGLGGPWAERLRDFSAISVRDDNSRRLVRGALRSDPELVLDPCLQFPPAKNAKAEGEPYIVLYGHGFPGWLLGEVRRWADLAGHRLVSVGYRNEAADVQRLATGPEGFARLIARSAGVVTNFFHGCVFALLNRRPFITAPSPYRFNKVRDLLQALGAGSQMVDQGTPQGAYAHLLGEPSRPQVFDRIEALRRSSADYLHQALGA